MKITSAKFVKGVVGSDDILFDERPQIAFVGRSNVGKSSVINTLTGKDDLVKVGKKPGKTTEINFFLIDNKIYFVDLPGYGYAQLSPDEREKISKRMHWYLLESGVQLAYAVMVLDTKVGFTDFDIEMAHLLREAGHPFIIIANKVDKLNRKETAQQLAKIKESSYGELIIPFSAQDKTGVQEVLNALLGDKSDDSTP